MPSPTLETDRDRLLDLWRASTREFVEGMPAMTDWVDELPPLRTRRWRKLAVSKTGPIRRIRAAIADRLIALAEWVR